jgi:cytoskeletal protein RodZ
MTEVTTAKEADAPETVAAEHDSVEPQAEDEAVESQVADEPNVRKSARLQVSISLRSFVIIAVIVAVVGAVGTLAWLYVGGERKLDEQTRRSENYAHAEKVALDYAVNAATMNFQDLNAWKVKLIAGTSPELKEKLTQAATSMEQILVPLEWSSTARPLAAKVRSVTGGTYVVDSFVGVLTKTVQSPDPLQSTATYSVTIDGAKNWQITDVGGIGSVVEQK